PDERRTATKTTSRSAAACRSGRMPWASSPSLGGVICNRYCAAPLAMLSTNIAAVCGRAAMCEEHARPRKCKDLKQMAAVPWRRVEGQLGWLTLCGSDVSIVAQSVPRDGRAGWPRPLPRGQIAPCRGRPAAPPRCDLHRRCTSWHGLPLQPASFLSAAAFTCDRGPKCSDGNRG